MWRLLIACLNDRKSVGHGKDCVWKFISKELGRRSSACRRVRTSSISNLLPRDITGDKTWILSTSRKPSAKAISGSLRRLLGRKNKNKVKSLRHVDHILRCKRHHPQRVLVTGPGDQSVNLQGHRVGYALFST